MGIRSRPAMSLANAVPSTKSTLPSGFSSNSCGRSVTRPWQTRYSRWTSFLSASRRFSRVARRAGSSAFSGEDGRDYLDVGECLAGTLDFCGHLDVTERDRTSYEVGDVAGLATAMTARRSPARGRGVG